jgi:hypothetical protein
MNTNGSPKLSALGLEFAAMALVLFTLVNCNGGKMEMDNTADKVTLSSIGDVPAEAWQKLSQRKIYFGHQSVGYNMLNGIKDIMNENPQIKLDIVETADPAQFNRPILAHSRVGRNSEPASKTRAFADNVGKGIGEKADVAFFKFCYVDIDPRADVSKVFRDYRDTMETLRTRYPKTVFIHVTTPLTVKRSGLAGAAKRLLGRPEGNIKRDEFNQLLRQAYLNKEPLFDLALVESTFQDGRRSLFEDQGKIYPSLVPQYTDDDGHLNARGRRVVAEQLLIFLARLSDKKTD